MKKLILTSVVALFGCFVAYGQNAGACQPKCGNGNSQTAGLYSLTDFSAKGGTAESRNCGTAQTKKCGVAELPSCGVAKKGGVAEVPSCGAANAVHVNSTPIKNCTPTVAESAKCGGGKAKSKSIAKL